MRKTVPWFQLFGNVGGLTTNEFCEVRGGYIMSEWHKLRFAQRHINMCSMPGDAYPGPGHVSSGAGCVVLRPQDRPGLPGDSLLQPDHGRAGEDLRVLPP